MICIKIYQVMFGVNLTWINIISFSFIRKIINRKESVTNFVRGWIYEEFEKQRGGEGVFKGKFKFSLLLEFALFISFSFIRK